MGEELNGEECKNVSYRIFRELKEKVSDQERAITTVISSHQHLVFQLESSQKTLNEISHTLKKLVDIEKELIHGTHTMNGLESRVEKLEKSRESEGCPALMKQNSKIEKLEEFSKEIKDMKKWIFSQVAVGICIVLWEFIKLGSKG